MLYGRVQVHLIGCKGEHLCHLRSWAEDCVCAYTIYTVQYIYIYIYICIYIYTTPRFGIGMIQPHHAWIYTWCHLCFMSYSATADNISSVQPLQKVREYFCNIVITMSDHVSIPIYIYTWAFSIPTTNLALNHLNMLCSVREAPTHIITFGIFSQSRYCTHFRTTVAAPEISLQGNLKWTVSWQ